MKKVVICLLLLLLLIGAYVLNDVYKELESCKNKLYEKENEPVMIEEPVIEEIHYNKLMIVAHPDDESIFGGEHLLNDEYYVVCVTCGVKDNRLLEFKKAMEFSNNKYEFWGHTDLGASSYISDWSYEKTGIKNQINEIINRQDWDFIITHNPSGEYGHKQHKMISKMVTDNISDKTKLYYFAKWHDKSELSEEEKNLIDKEKLELLSIYKSQHLDLNSRFLYMFRHEDWIKYEDWVQ